MHATWVGEWLAKGRKLGRSWFAKVLAVLFLVSVGYVLIYPVLFMVSSALKQFEDIANPQVNWVPQAFSLDNFKLVLPLMDYWRSLAHTLMIAGGSAFVQVASTALIGYGFARFKFPGRNLLFYFVIFTIIVPPQTMAVPLFIQFRSLGWLNSYWPFLVPPVFGMGLKGGLMIYIFRQFFRGLPYQLEEAAWIDGAGFFRTFTTIMLPQAGSAILTVFLFSFVWHWNDYFEPVMYLSNDNFYTLGMHLTILEGQLNNALRLASTGANVMATPEIMAATLLFVLPPIIAFLFLQKYFVEGIERTGLTGQ